MEPTEEMKRMARGFADEAVELHGAARGTHTWQIAYDAALSAVRTTIGHPRRKAYDPYEDLKDSNHV